MILLNLTIFGAMKKTLAIFFLSTYLLSTTELFQLLKLPILIEHFVEHQEQDHGMSFLGYLIHHYGGHEPDADYATDMKLPFMQLTDGLALSASLTPNFIHFHFSHLVLPHGKPLFTHQDDDLVSAYLRSIWQPPRRS